MVSAVIAMDHGGPETFIFGSDKTGSNINFTDLEGSFPGELNHEKALSQSGNARLLGV